MGALMAVDIGTSSCRAVVFSMDLKEEGRASREYDIISPFTGAAEQDADEIFAAVLDVMAESLQNSGRRGSEIRFVSFAAVMHSLLPLDKHKRPLMNAWTWADLRSSPQAEALKGNAEFYQRTGCPIHPMYWPAKLAHIREHRREIWDSIHHLVSLKEYFMYRLNGELAADASVASSTGLLDIHTRQWDTELLQKLQVNPKWFSPVLEPTERLTGLRPAMADRTGLDPSVPLILGSSDGVLSNVGSGAVRPKVMALMVGTSAAIRELVPQPKLHPDEMTWCYYLGSSTWVSGGATNNGGNVLKWFRREMESDQVSYADLSDWAAKSPAGSSGLIFLPFLVGERSPHWNYDARGVFFGMHLQTKKNDMVRAAMEGVGYQLYSIYEALTTLNGVPDQIRCTGGMVHSPVWLQIMADIFGHSLEVPDFAEGSAFGAAVLGKIALGEMSSFSDAEGAIPQGRVIDFNPKVHDFYKDLFVQNRALYRCLAARFKEYQDFLASHRKELPFENDS